VSNETHDASSEAIEASLAPIAGPRQPQRLKTGAIGIFAVLFMALANAAPITAMTGNVPIAIGYGNGVGAPAGYLVATVVLTIFTVGFVSMAKHITTTGTFLGFTSHGLGQVWGMGSGLLATLAYVVFEGSLVGIFASFARSFVLQLNGPDISWLWYALLCVAVVAVLGYYDVEISGRVLGIFLITEVLMLGAFDLWTVFHTGPDGFVPSALNPANAFKAAPTSPDGAIVGSAGIGLFFAFWSWIGYETTAVYGEESREPRRIIPRATLIAVVLLGFAYTLTSWMAVVANGVDKSIAVSRGNNPFDLYLAPVQSYFGTFGHDLYQLLTVTGSFACALAFHNAASRYIYALGREGVSDTLSRTIGATHGKHKSPHIASLLQSLITLLIVLGFYFFVKPSDPTQDVAYLYLYGLLSILGTLAILIVIAVCSIAVVVYFHVGNNHPETKNWWNTFLAPIIGFLGISYVIYLLLQNINFAAGAAADSLVFKWTPWIVLAVYVFGLAFALILRSTNRAKYDLIGRTVLEEAHERVDA